MGDRYAGKLSLTSQPRQQPGSLNRVPASAGGKDGNVTSAGWQVTLCDPIWHVSSRSGEAFARTAIHDFTFTLPLWTDEGDCITCRINAVGNTNRAIVT